MTILAPAATITPQETFAVIVGIEEYSAGKAWNLDGPAVDAARFASWLAGHGVPADNMALFVSPLAKNNGLSWPTDSKLQHATQDNIYQLLHDTLRTRRERLLILFWGGHGIFHGGETRRLYYADASKHAKRNLDLNGMLRLLNADQYGQEAWPRQIIIVDACANLAEDGYQPQDLPREQFAVGTPRATPEQFVLFAARPGEAAVNLNAEQTGLFSRELLKELEARPAGEWPPDMEAITRALVVRFERLRAEGKARQSPVYFFNRNWQSSERTIGQFPVPPTPATPPRPRNLSLQDKEELRDALLACPVMKQRESRDDLCGNLRAEIANSIERRGNSRGDTSKILDACLYYPNGLLELLRAVSFADGNAPDVAALEAVMRRIVPTAFETL